MHARVWNRNCEPNQCKDELVRDEIELARCNHRLNERVERPDEKTVKITLADKDRDVADFEEERVMQCVPQHPKGIQKRHLPEIPPFIDGNSVSVAQSATSATA